MRNSISSALLALFPTVNSGRGPLLGRDYTVGWGASPGAGQKPPLTILSWTPQWPLAAGATYPAQPTAAQITAALAPTPQQTFDAAVAAGYTVPGVTPALVLDLSDGARAQFTGLVVLLDKLMASGQLLATSTQAIADKSGALHSLPVSQIDSILMAYGAYYAGLYNTLHAATTAAPAS